MGTKLKEELTKARNFDEKSILKLYESYYSYVDSVVLNYPIEKLRTFVRVLATKKFNRLFEDYITSDYKSEPSNYFFSIIRFYNRRLYPLCDGYVFLAREFPQCKEQLKPYIFSSLVFDVKRFIKDNHLENEDIMKFKLYLFTMKFIENSLKHKKKGIKERFKKELNNLNYTKLSNILKSDDSKLKREEIIDKYHYLVCSIASKNTDICGFDELFLFLDSKYKDLVNKYFEGNVKSDLKKYITNCLSYYVTTLRELKEEKIKEITFPREMLEAWTKEDDVYTAYLKSQFAKALPNKYVAFEKFTDLTPEEYYLKELCSFNLENEKIIDREISKIKKN